MESLKTTLIEMIYDPYSPIKNFNLAAKYHDMGQGAIAIGLYLRCAEFTKDKNLACEALLRCSLCVSKQEGREQKEIHILRHAVSALPSSPQANLYWSLYYSYRKQWHESYTIICNALEHVKHIIPQRFIIDLPFYNGIVSLLFQKAFCSIELGKLKEARDIYYEILNKYSPDINLRIQIENNLRTLPEPWMDPIDYNKVKDYKNLKFKFNNSENIERNYSQIYQDMFVLSMLNGKKNGTYLEIGAGNYINGNNTYLLEKEFDWKGISIDLNQNYIIDFMTNRNNKCICADAKTIDYDKLLTYFSPNNQIDYLQLDCDPANITYEILLRIPFDKYKFGVITYEHDYYYDSTKSYREKSREYLKSKGYILVAGNISPNNFENPFEDWWIHPELVSAEIYNKFIRPIDTTICGAKYMLEPPDKPLKYFVTFGSENVFKKQLKRLKEQVEGVDWFDEIDIHTQDTMKVDLAPYEDFIKNNPRGYGYWIWKPMVIENKLKEMRDGDILFFLDCGSSIISSDYNKIQNYIDILNNYDVLLFEDHDRPMCNFLKMNVIKEFNILNSPILNTPIVESACIIIKKTDYSVRFIERWKEYLLKDNHMLVNDIAEGEQLSTYIEHRHDQAILGIMARQESHKVKVGDGIAELYTHGPFFSSRLTDNGQRKFAKQIPSVWVNYWGSTP